MEERYGQEVVKRGSIKTGCRSINIEEYIRKNKDMETNKHIESEPKSQYFLGDHEHQRPRARI